MEARERHIGRFEMNKYLAAIGILILGAIYIALALGSDVPAGFLSPIISVICFILLFIGGRRLRATFPVAVIYLLLYAVTLSPTLGSIALVIFTSTSLATNEIILSRGRAWRIICLYATLPLTATVAYLMTKNAFVTAIIALPYILFTLQGFLMKKRVNRKNVIISVSAALVLFAAAMLGIYMLIAKMDLSDIKNIYVTSRDGFIKYIAEYSAEINGETVYLFGENIDFAKEILEAEANLIPSAIMIAAIVIAYLLNGYQASMLEKFSGYEFIPESVMRMDISAAAAATYLIAFILSFTTDSYGGIPFGSVVCQNLYMILTPALVYAGVTSIRSFLKGRSRILGILILIPTVLLAFSGYLFMILSLLGIICIFGRSAKAWADKKE